jgi:hypothetical protein
VGTKKNSEVDKYQCKRDDWPAASRHIFMLDWDEHDIVSVGKSAANAQMPSGN